MSELIEDNLHPSVREFKTFINKHPKLIKEIRRGGDSWQEYYEKWALLGESDPMWENYQSVDAYEKKESPTTSHFELLGQLMKYAENTDIDKVQKQVHQLSNTITTVQEVLRHFQESKVESQSSKSKPDPFNWFRD